MADKIRDHALAKETKIVGREHIKSKISAIVGGHADVEREVLTCISMLNSIKRHHINVTMFTAVFVTLRAASWKYEDVDIDKIRNRYLLPDKQTVNADSKLDDLKFDVWRYCEMILRIRQSA